MTEPDEFFEELRREYLAEAPARLNELRKDLEAMRAGESDAAASLKVRFHRLAGSGGSYGFPEISTAARAAEQWLGAHPTPDAAGIEQVAGMLAQLATAFDLAGSALGLPALVPPASVAFGWRALVIGSTPHLIDLIEATLLDARYVVDRKPPSYRPREVTASERPDLIVLAGEEAQEVFDLSATWGLPGPSRAATVVAVTPTGLVDPLAQPFASLDAIIPANRLERELLGLSRAIGRAATGPRSVLIINADTTGGQALAASLEAGDIRTRIASSAAAVRDAIEESDTWDAVVTDWLLPDTTALAAIRWLRRTPAYRITPILVVAPPLTDDDRLAAIRAGADDVLIQSGPGGFITQSIRARIDRSRLLRSISHRDDLTGLLNHESLVEEMERGIESARRAGENLALILFDIDHFRRSNEQYGQAAGNAILMHVAQAIGATIRSSDLVARLGGEEFGALIRRCRPADAVRVAEKIRAAIADTPVEVGDQTIQVRVSCGVACYPDHGGMMSQVLRAADRALRMAKRQGRDQVMVAG
ncbi:MAG: diguanylate cyclase [Gemmatimonadales bacterium]